MLAITTASWIDVADLARQFEARSPALENTQLAPSSGCDKQANRTMMSKRNDASVFSDVDRAMLAKQPHRF